LGLAKRGGEWGPGATRKIATSVSAVKGDLTSNPPTTTTRLDPNRHHGAYPSISVAHNNQIQKNHFRKDWQKRVRVHFDQPGRKHRRRENRIAKAAAVAPRPVDKLRPVVRCPTNKYNRRVRAGRGFTLAELKVNSTEIFVRPASQEARSHRWYLRRPPPYQLLQGVPGCQRCPSSGLQGPPDPLPRKSGQFKKLDSSAEDVKAVKASLAEGKTEGFATRVEATFPIDNLSAGNAVTEVKRDSMPKVEGSVYRQLRDARADARNRGQREKRAKAKADEESAAKK
ncbi:uncharacterized protein N7477_001508, partial [Penicillium maclennaniae]|uniref:uncharacterized protein n=1 Tax=Penicillium maclennaniae TaxID=1343394 RepID=UPI00253FBB73